MLMPAFAGLQKQSTVDCFRSCWSMQVAMGLHLLGCQLHACLCGQAMMTSSASRCFARVRMLVLVLGWRAAAFLVGALLFGELPVTSIGVVAADDESDMEDEGLEDNLACHNAALISDVSSRSDVWSVKLHAITLADAGKGRMTDPVPQAEVDWTKCRAVPRFAVEQGTDDAGLHLLLFCFALRCGLWRPGDVKIRACDNFSWAMPAVGERLKRKSSRKEMRVGVS